MEAKEKFFVGNKLLNGGKLSLAVNYSKKLNEMILPGRYDIVDPRIVAKNFQIKESYGGRLVILTARLFHFKETMYTDEIISQVEQTDYRLAMIPEIMAFGATYPNLQRGVSIIALGQPAGINGSYFVPGLTKSGNQARMLKLYSFQGVWPPICHFLAVKEE